MARARTTMPGRMCDGCGKPGGTPVQGKWYLHAPCARPFMNGVARGGLVSLDERNALRAQIAALRPDVEEVVGAAKSALDYSDDPTFTEVVARLEAWLGVPANG